MNIKVNGFTLKLNDEEIRELESGKIPEKFMDITETKTEKVYKQDGSFELMECKVLKIEPLDHKAVLVIKDT